MYIFWILAGLMLTVSLIGGFPPINKNAKKCHQTIMGIGMISYPFRKYDDDGIRFIAGTLYNHESKYKGLRYPAILSQELAEWWFAWFCFLMAGGAVGHIASYLGVIDAISSTIAFVVAVFLWGPPYVKSTWMHRQRELMGWTVEYVTGKRLNIPGYDLDTLSYRMKSGYSYIFGEMTWRECHYAMKRRIIPATIISTLFRFRISRNNPVK